MHKIIPVFDHSDLPNASRMPTWIRQPLAEDVRYSHTARTVHAQTLHTVCEEARCPNIFECWGQGTATIMILGETCTRGCRFCAVNTGDPGGVVDPREPENVGRALGQLDLAYVVVTMVDRDDLLDGGAAHTAQTVRRIKHHSPDLLVETLVGDYAGVRADVGEPDGVEHLLQRAALAPRPVQHRKHDIRCARPASARSSSADARSITSAVTSNAPAARSAAPRRAESAQGR